MSYIRFDDYRWFQTDLEPGYVYGRDHDKFPNGVFQAPGVCLGGKEQFAELMMRVLERQIDDAETLERVAEALATELEVPRQGNE